MDTQIAIPTPQEVGYVNGGQENFYTYGRELENIPELQWPQCLSVYDRMRNDSQISAVLSAIALPIEATTWRLDPNGASDEVTEFIAQQLDLPIIGKEGEHKKKRRRRRFSWAEHLRHALLMVPFGAMFFEQVVETTPEGLWGIRKIAPRMPDTLQAINVARDGGLISIDQKPPGDIGVIRASDATKTTIPIDRLVAYSYRREGGNWAGRSILRPAYPHWALKQPLLKIEALAVERNGVGVPDYENPPGATPEQIEKGRKMAESYRAGSSAGMSRPSGSKFQLLGTTGQIMSARPVIEYHDSQIARVALAHFLNLDGKGGSYALATTHQDLYTIAENSLGTEIAGTANHHIVEDLVDWNWGPDEPAPRIVFDDLRSDSLSIANSLRTLADAGLIRPDRSIEEWLRRDLGAPAKDTAPPEQPWTPETETEGGAEQ